MLNPSDCFIAPISAAKEMTLVLPRADYEHRCLIVMCEAKPLAICLDELPQIGRFFAFKCDENDNWHGLHIPGVRIELDETSLIDAGGHYAPRGAMVRQEDKLSLVVQSEGNYQTQRSYAAIYENLPPCTPNMSAGFRKWQIVLGESTRRQVLWQVEANPAAT